MTREITGAEPDPRAVYADIINHPHHVSDHHPQISLYDRAAQFAPFAALTGYDDLIDEKARLVDRRMELGDIELELLNQNLNRIASMIAEGIKPTVSITYFIPDPLKAGGRYETITETVRKVDPVRQLLILNRKTGLSGSWETIPVSDILAIRTDPADIR